MRNINRHRESDPYWLAHYPGSGISGGVQSGVKQQDPFSKHAAVLIKLLVHLLVHQLYARTLNGQQETNELKDDWTGNGSNEKDQSEASHTTKIIRNNI